MPWASLQQVLPARDTAGLRQEFIALTFLGSFGWISLLNPFLPAAPQIVASFELPVSVVRPPVRFRPSVLFPSPRKFLEQTEPRHQIVTAIIGQDTRRNVTDDVTAGSDAFSSALKLFPRASRRRFSEPTTNEGHLSREKATHLDFESFHRKLDIQLDELYVKLPIIHYIMRQLIINYPKTVLYS